MSVKLELVQNVDTARTAEKRSIPVALVDVPAGRQKIDPDFVETLAADIASNGLITPINVVEVAGRYHLIHGAARLAAVAWCGMGAIEAFVEPETEFGVNAAVRLRSIAARMLQRELSLLEKSVLVAEWRDLYEQVVGIIKPGRKSIRLKSETNSDETLQLLADQFAGTFREVCFGME